MHQGFRLALATLTIVLGSLLASGSVQAGGGGCVGPPGDGHGTRVDMKANCMTPTVLHVNRGDVVTFHNDDEAQHTVSGMGLRAGTGQGWGSFEPLAQSQTVSHRFHASGVYPYYCLLHPGMVGAIVVADGSGDGAAADGTSRYSSPDGFARGETASSRAGGGRSSAAAWPGALTSRFGLMLEAPAGAAAIIAALATAIRTQARRRAQHDRVS